jgi:hypothetical protein
MFSTKKKKGGDNFVNKITFIIHRQHCLYDTSIKIDFRVKYTAGP